MNPKWIIALGAVGLAVMLGGSLIIGVYFFETMSQITNQIGPRPPYNGQIGTNVTMRNVTVFHEDNKVYQGAYKPYVITTNLTAQDYRLSTGTGSLRIGGSINNTGDGTAYELSLLLVAMNSGGKAISTSIDLGGITLHMCLLLDRTLEYNGSALVNCTVTPFYLDLIDSQNRPRP